MTNRGTFLKISFTVSDQKLLPTGAGEISTVLKVSLVAKRSPLSRTLAPKYMVEEGKTAVRGTDRPDGGCVCKFRNVPSPTTKIHKDANNVGNFIVIARFGSTCWETSRKGPWLVKMRSREGKRGTQKEGDAISLKETEAALNI